MSFDGELKHDKWDNTKLKITGTVKNSGSTHGAAYTAAFLAVFDETNTKVIDVNANYVGGTSSAGYNWAVYPLKNETVDIFYDFAQFGQVGDAYRSAFMYYEGKLDIAALFPGYANSNGAAGYFILDTTIYEDGVHTIQWTVTDTPGGDTDGIGSRYFNITNGGL